MCKDLRKSDLPVARIQRQTPQQRESNSSSLFMYYPAVPSKQKEAQVCLLTPLVGRHQVSRCSPFARWLFEPESNMSLLFFSGTSTQQFEDYILQHVLREVCCLFQLLCGMHYHHHFQCEHWSPTFQEHVMLWNVVGDVCQILYCSGASLLLSVGE